MSNIDRILASRRARAKDIKALDGTIKSLSIDPDLITIYPPPQTLGSNGPQCDQCREHFRSVDQQKYDNFAYEREVDDDEATRTTLGLVVDFTADYLRIQKGMRLYGDMIRARWQSLNKEGREQALLSIEPDIQQEAWPEVTDMLGSQGDWVEKRQRCTTFLVPWLNIDTLCGDRDTMLRLLQVRGSFHPADWQAHDHMYADGAIRHGLVGMNFNSNAVCMSSSDDQLVGTLTKFTCKGAHALAEIGYPLAEVIFRAERRIYDFLRKVIEYIITDIEDKPASVDVVTKAEDQKYIDVNSNALPTLFNLWQMPPLPPRIQMEQVVQLAKDGITIAEDDLRSLQTDPQHFMQRLKILKEAKLFSQFSEAQQGPLLCNELWKEPSRRILAWQGIEFFAIYLARAFARLYDAHQDNNTSSDEQRDELEREYDSLATRFMTVSRAIQREQIWDSINDQMPKVKRFESHFIYDRRPPYSTSRHFRENLGKRTWSRENLEQDPIFWALQRRVILKISGEKQNPLLPFLVEQMNSSSEDVRLQMTPSGVWPLISDAAAMSWIDVFMQHNRPYHSERSEKEVQVTIDALRAQGEILEGHKLIFEDYKRVHDRNLQDEHDISNRRLVGAAKSLKRLLKEYDWPVDVKNRVLVLGRVSHCRSLLLEFWNEMLKARVGDLQDRNPHVQEHDIAHSEEVRPLTFFNDFTYRREVMEELKEYEGKKKALEEFNAAKNKRKRKAPAVPEPESPTKRTKREGLRSSTSAPEPTLASIKKKIKAEDDKAAQKKLEEEEAKCYTQIFLEELQATRADLPTPTNTPESTPPASPKYPKIPIKKSSMLTFRCIWGVGSGSVRWTDIDLAMADAGYHVSTISGSHNSFVKADGMGKGSVPLVNPHNTSATMDKWQLRDWRRALERKVGLTLKSFVERKEAAKEKEKEKQVEEAPEPRLG